MCGGKEREESAKFLVSGLVNLVDNEVTLLRQKTQKKEKALGVGRCWEGMGNCDKLEEPVRSSSDDALGGIRLGHLRLRKDADLLKSGGKLQTKKAAPERKGIIISIILPILYVDTAARSLNAGLCGGRGGSGVFTFI